MLSTFSGVSNGCLILNTSKCIPLIFLPSLLLLPFPPKLNDWHHNLHRYASQKPKYHHQSTNKSFQLDVHHVSNCAIYHHLTCCQISGCHHLLDYCCSFPTGLLTSTLALLWSVFHTPARVTLGKYKSDCGITLLRTLQWLPIAFKIKATTPDSFHTYLSPLT